VITGAFNLLSRVARLARVTAPRCQQESTAPTCKGLSAAGDTFEDSAKSQQLDGMNEMSEMTSLRLQMTMDRRSKFISTLSQMMKKISTTQDTLVQNMK
jgi:hypothetical protein